MLKYFEIIYYLGGFGGKMGSEANFFEKISGAVKKYGVDRVFTYEITDSTNTQAKLFKQSNANEECSDAIFIARAQTSGRGTHGRSFESPSGAGLYISFLFHPHIPITDCGSITVYAATRVLRAIERFRSKSTAKIGIKWVNDIYADGKKISGILTEGSVGENGALDYAIVGIGINIKSGLLSKDLSQIAASLEDFGINTSAEELAIALSEEFFQAIKEITSDSVMREYRQNSILIGKRVKISNSVGEKICEVVGISDSGELIIKDEKDETRNIISATVSLL